MEKKRQRGNKRARFQEVMAALSNAGLTDRDGVLKTVMDLLAGSLPAGRLGLWLLNEERSMMVCRNLIVKSKDAREHTGGGTGIQAERYPGYLADLEKGPVTLAGGISAPALLDAPVMAGGKIAGILSVEHACLPGEWSPEELCLVSAGADRISMAMEAYRLNQMDEALRKNKEYSIFENMMDVFSHVDIDGIYRYVSPSHKWILGYDPEDLLGRHVFEIIHPNDLERIIPAIQEGIINRRSGKIESRLKHADGTYSWFEIIGNPFLNEEGRVSGAIYNVRDIRERKQMEQALRESEERYREILSSIEEAYYEVDLSGTFTFFNDSLCRITGYNREEIQGANYRLIARNPSELIATYNRVYDSGNPEKAFVWTLVTRDKREIFVEVSISLILDQQGDPAGFRGIARDITERRKAEMEINYQRKHFEALFKNSSDAIIYFNWKEGIVDINARFTGLFGYSLEEVKGKDLDMLITGSDKVKEAKKLTRRVREGKPVELESARYNKLGEPIEVQIKGIPVIVDGENMGGYAIYSDITERKNYEKQLRYLNIHDPLTGVYNRTYFEEEMRRLEGGRDYPISIMVIDLDDLKFINDTLGHLAGDRALKACAGVLQMSIRKKDVLSRIGGDEFVLVLPRTSREAAARIAGRIYSNLNLYRETGPEVLIGLSLGYATATCQKQPLMEVLVEADNKMYLHKSMRDSSR